MKDDEESWEHKYKSNKTRCLNKVIKLSFPNISNGSWNDMEMNVVQGMSEQGISRGSRESWIKAYAEAGQHELSSNSVYTHITR